MNSRLTPREVEEYEKIKEFFLDGGIACVACLVKEHWGIDYDEAVSSKNGLRGKYLVYKDKTSNIISKLYREFKRTQAWDHPMFTERASEHDVLWLMTVYQCPLHPTYRQYKILVNGIDYEIADVRAKNRIEQTYYAKDSRFQQALRQFPKMFQKRIRTTNITMGYIEEKKKKEK